MSIKELLKNYNKYKSEIEILTSEIEILKLQQELFDEEAESLKATVYEEGMPLHFGNEFNSKTENVILRKENIPLTATKLELKKLELTKNIILVDSKLNLLDNHERFIVEKKYIENIRYNWEIRDMYKSHFSRYISDTAFFRKLRSALHKMGDSSII